MFDFQCSEELIKRGTHHRLLVEPLDIPQKRRASSLLLTQDSCLWAYVEDISNLMHKNVDTAGKRKDLENRERAGLGRSFDWRIYPHKCGQLVVASDDRTAARDFSLRLYYSLSYANCLELIT